MRQPLTRREALATLLAGPAALALAGLPRPVTATSPADDGPGGVLVVPRDADLALVRADGAGEHILLSLGADAFTGDAAWSPDGGRIVFSLYTPEGGGGAHLAVVSVRPEAAGPVVLVPRDREGTLLAAPAWAPGGAGLAFENLGVTATPEGAYRVEWVAADGSGRRPLVEGGRNPAISPDGATLAYVKSGRADDRLFARPLAGGPERQLVVDGQMLALAYPRFSPDGARLAFAGIGEPGGQFGKRVEIGECLFAAPPGHPRGRPGLHGLPWDLFVVDADGANLRRLARVAEDDAAVAWSPDGRRIAVGGASGLRLVAVGDGDERRISDVGSLGGIDWW